MMVDFTPVWISLKTAVVTMAIVFVAGIAVAWWVVSRKNEHLKIVADGILTLPLVLPPTVAGFFLLYVFGNNRVLGKFFIETFNVQIAFSWLGTVLAAGVIAFPLMYRSARGALEQVDGDFINAGRTLGMSEQSIFFRVLLPNALPGIITGGILSFARALGEFGATAMIAGNIAGETRTLPLAVYSAVISGDMDVAADYVIIIMAVCFVIVVGMNWYQYRCKKRQEM